MNPIAERFWRHVVRGESNQCWGWTLHRDKNGYGTFKMLGHTYRAPRVAFFLKHDYWPLVVRHSCDNPACCNPDHLLDGTHKDNAQDRSERGHTHSAGPGEAHHNSKLTTTEVLSIRQRYASGEPQRMLADEYGVSQGHISNICGNQKWKHLKVA
jgi:hypothetical protein